MICSRRTPAEAIKKLNEASNLKVWCFADQDPNPYTESLVYGSNYIVTSDSVAMICDACTTGKKVLIVEAAHEIPEKFQRFISDIVRKGLARTCSLEKLRESIFSRPQTEMKPVEKLTDTEKVVKVIHNSIIKRMEYEQGITFNSHKLH